MPNRQFIRPVPVRTPPGVSAAQKQFRTLPYDLLKEASNRLGVLCLLAGSLWIVATALDHIAMRAVNQPNWNQLELPDAVAAVSVALSLGLFFYSRQDLREPRFILDLGLGYMVFTGAALGLIMHWGPASPGHVHIFPMITWVGAVVLMFAAIVPNSPMKTLIAGLIAVSMNPLGMMIARARGVWDGPPSDLLLMHYPDYLLAGVAVVISHVVTKLGQKVNKARDMGSYELVSLIGRGGMGEVWRARHRMLTRDAALKLIQPDMLSRGSGRNSMLLQKRFEQEAKATASLRSPHTIHLYDFGISEDGIFYYVMELLDGIDLDTLVRRFGPQPPARVVYILRQVCRSLADAHDHGMIHRDIKPTNIFLCRMGNEFDFAKVLDFGLVKVLETPDLQLTGESATTGTPAYMAPEVLMGSSKMDGRIDIYALGCVAYWLLTGKMVFEEKAPGALMLAHVQTVPVKPSQRSNLPIPDALELVVMQCLSKDPKDRPAGAEALRRLLENSAGAEAWSPEDAQRWWLAHRPANPPPETEGPPSAENEATAFPTHL